jgi:hypothetical protein
MSDSDDLVDGPGGDQAARVGRPSEIGEAGPRIIAALRNGADRRAAAEYAGVPDGTVRSWLSRGRGGLEPYAEFAGEFEAAEAEAAVRMAKVVFDAAHAAKDWRPALEWLKRRRRREWGDPRPTEAQPPAEPVIFHVEIGGKPPRTPEDLSTQELLATKDRLDELKAEETSE